MPGEHITQEQADEYAIGSLEPELERAIALHLAECTACRDIVRDAERLVALLAASQPVRRASGRLRDRVFTATGIRKPSPAWRALTIGRAAAGLAAIIIAVGAFSGMLGLRTQVDALRSQNSDLQRQIDEALSQKVALAALSQQLEDQQAAAAELRETLKSDSELLIALISPRSEVAAVVSVDPERGSIGRLVWDDDQKRVWFVASQLRQLPPGQTYQLWVSSGGRFYSLGTFAPDEAGFARFETRLPEGITSYDTAVITIERAGGSPVRQGPSVFFVADLSRLTRN
jgi:anti-sigma-K factor RskA